MGSIWKMVDIIEGRESLPSSIAACVGLMSSLRAFLEKGLPMPEDAIVVDENSPAKGMTLLDFIRKYGIE